MQRATVRTHVNALIALAACLACAAVACRRGAPTIGPAPERANTIPSTAPTSNGPPVVDALVGHAGEVVTIEGRVTTTVNAHLIKSVPGKVLVYIDLVQTPAQIVAYMRERPRCPGAVRLVGTVSVLAGNLGSKAGTDYAEPQLDVDSWSCR